MVSSSMLIVDPAFLVKVVMEVVVDSGWMVFPPTPAPVCKHMLTLACPVCWCIIPGGFGTSARKWTDRANLT